MQDGPFLGQAFHGGTDISGPLEMALAKLEDQRWQSADLLIASDGEFGATREIVARLAAAAPPPLAVNTTRALGELIQIKSRLQMQ